MTDFAWVMLVLAVAMVCGTVIVVALLIAADKRRFDAGYLEDRLGRSHGQKPEPKEPTDA
jgi:hypothetical protein